MTQPFMKTVSCTISTLSLVHIGCEEDYYPTNYVIDGGFLHHFSEEGLLGALSLNEKKQLAKLSEEQNDDGIKKLQAFIYDKKTSLQNYATHNVPVSKELEKFYISRIGKTAQHEGGGRKVDNKLAIARHAFNPYSQTPYFAGSSIKGAMRTALLNAENKGSPLNERLSENYPAKTSNRQLQEDLLKYKGIPEDPLRLLKVGDATYQHPDALHGLEIRFAVNRKNKASKEKSMAETKGLYQLLECLPAHRSRSLNFDLSFLADKNLNYRWDVQQIAKACNAFFLPQLEKELALMQQLNYANSAWLTGLEKLLASELNEALKNNQAFLLRIGQHGGAESNTLEGVRHIKIMQGKNPAKYLSKPTTIWLAGDNKDQQHDLLPFGWVLVEIGQTDLKQTAQFLKNQAEPDYQRQQQLQVLAIQKTEFLNQQRLEREKRQQQEQEHIEQQRQQNEAEQAKQQKLANMTEAQKRVFELTEALEKDKNPDPNGTLRQTLTSTLKQAETWTTEEKQALLAIGNTLCSLWGKPKKLKDQLKTLQG